ncbi:MAG: HAMP domain-containing sensor histidine kinase, partial [Endomicrobiia bacterium]|nr:HAMP domain-containing sensor histidine kinase [Endomicrobiia bacterium]
SNMSERESALHDLPSERELIRRLEWLINLRWLAAGGVMIVTLGARYILGINLDLPRLLGGGAAMFIYNKAFFFYNERLKTGRNSDGWFDKAYFFANVQIAADIVALAYLLHFSGGVENPFAFYFVFHMIIAGILLSNRAAYLQAALAVVVFGSVSVAEAAGFLAHYHLDGFIRPERCPADFGYTSGVLAVFASTLFLAVFMTTSIVNKLRSGEKRLAAANDELKEQDKIKSQYVRTVSHDMQASLSSIQSCLKVVLDDMAGDISSKAREMVGRAEHRSRRLLAFVKDLLNLSRMRATDIAPKRPVVLGDVLAASAAKFSAKAAEKNIEIALDISGCGSIEADPEAMEQLFDNLVSNALKYTSPGGNVSVKCAPPSGAEDFALVEVSDTGIGIPPEDIPRIFEDFYRGRNAREVNEEGTGLGLAIAAQIVKSHCGRIRAISVEGKGSRFLVELPRRQAAHSGAATREDSPRPGGQKS